MLLTRGAMTAACAVLAAACGSTAAPGSSGTPCAPTGMSPGCAASGASGSSATSSRPASTTSAAKASLDITLSGGSLAAKQWTLRCDPPGGTQPDPAAICSQLLKVKNIFRPQLVKVMCPMILANARSFVISGTWYGHKVHETIVDGGCDLGRWSVLHRAFN
jgi:Subtilisin inhibitor-like